MATTDFKMWPELAAGKHEVCDLPLCRVLLMDDGNFPCWLVLVPRVNGVREVLDLTSDAQQQLWAETLLATRAVQELHQPHKLNIATLGNVVSQLHVHVTGRQQDDPAWPGPCYGAVPARPLEAGAVAGMVAALRSWFASQPASSGSGQGAH